MHRATNAISTVVATSLLFATGCATTKLTRQDALRQNEAVAQLSDGFEDARGRHGALLAPTLFEATQKHLDEAIAQARREQKAEADSVAKLGLASLKKLNAAITTNRHEMEEVLDTRERAVDQGAGDLFKDKFAKADETFRDACLQLENGEVDKARSRRPALIKEYAALELEALKKGMVEMAKKAIEDAKEAGAKKYAPKTLRKAEEELDLVVSILEADRTQTDKSDAHAKMAAWNAHRAVEIANILQYYDSQDFTEEDVVLWYQGQLQRIRRSLRDEALPFDQANAQVIRALRDDALALKAVMADMRKTNQLTQQQIRDLEGELEKQRQAHQQEKQQLLAEKEAQAKELQAQLEKQMKALQSGNQTQLAKLQQQAAEAQKAAADKVVQLKNQLSAQAQAQAEAERREQRAKARFESVQALFGEDEAEVFRKGDNVLIRLGGFAFRPGKSEIEAKNYGLLNKVVAAISTFPSATVTITGHTDSRGSDERNLELSSERALSVREFLSTVGGITGDKLAAEGKGEAQPVANNETTEGRAANRRIDVLIVNSPEGAEQG